MSSVKKKLALMIFLVFSITTLIQFAFSLAGEEEKAIVTYVEGMAKKQKLQEIDWLNVVQNTPVISGERVRTFTESRAELDIAQLDRIRMAPKTTIDILKLYEESKEQIRESKIVLKSGDLWANVGKKNNNLKFSIDTPVAAAAITGTTLRLRVDADSSAELRVYSGEVELSRSTEADQKSVKKSLKPQEVPGPTEIAGPQEVTLEQWRLIVKSMQKVRVNKQGEVVDSGSFSREDEEEKSDWVQWNLKRDRGLQ